MRAFGGSNLFNEASFPDANSSLSRSSTSSSEPLGMRRGTVMCGEAAPAWPPVPTGCPCHGPCCWSRSPQPQMPPGGLRASLSPPSPAVTGKPPELVRAPAFLTQGPAHSHGWGGRDSPNRAGIRRAVAKILGGVPPAPQSPPSNPHRAASPLGPSPSWVPWRP